MTWTNTGFNEKVQVKATISILLRSQSFKIYFLSQILIDMSMRLLNKYKNIKYKFTDIV